MKTEKKPREIPVSYLVLWVLVVMWLAYNVVTYGVMF